MLCVKDLLFNRTPFSQNRFVNTYNNSVVILDLIHCFCTATLLGQSTATVYTYTQLMNKSQTMTASPAY